MLATLPNRLFLLDCTELKHLACLLRPVESDIELSGFLTDNCHECFSRSWKSPCESSLLMSADQQTDRTSASLEALTVADDQFIKCYLHIVRVRVGFLLNE